MMQHSLEPNTKVNIYFNHDWLPWNETRVLYFYCVPILLGSLARISARRRSPQSESWRLRTEVRNRAWVGWRRRRRATMATVCSHGDQRSNQAETVPTCSRNMTTLLSSRWFRQVSIDSIHTKHSSLKVNGEFPAIQESSTPHYIILKDWQILGISIVCSKNKQGNGKYAIQENLNT
jgi:hypothetical protein